MFHVLLFQGCIFFATVLQNAAENNPIEVTTPTHKQHRRVDIPTGIDSYSRNTHAETNETIDCGQYANCTRSSKSCYCDELCPYYNDCCPELTNSSYSSTSADIKIASSSCQSVFMDKHYPVWVVSQCPVSGEECLPNTTTSANLEDIIPVTGDDNFVYVNGKCAKCHGIYQYTHWYLSITENTECNFLAQTVSIRSLTEMLWNDHCGIMLHHPYGMARPRRCVENIEIVEGCPPDRRPVISKVFGPNYQNEMCCMQDNISHCTVHKYTCFTGTEEDPLTPDDLAGKYGRLYLRPRTLLLQFGQISGNPVEVNGVHYINPQFQVVKRFEIDDELHEMYDSIRVPFTCVIRSYFMMRNLQIQEITLRLERIDCINSTHGTNTVVSDFNMKALKYFTNPEEIQKLNMWLRSMEITYRMVDETHDILLTTVSAMNEDKKCQNATVHELFVHRLRQKYLQPLHPSFVQNSKICALLENGTYTHSRSKQNEMCLVNSITAIQRSSEVDVDMRCSDRKLKLPDATSSGLVINAGESEVRLHILRILLLSLIHEYMT